MKIFYFMRTIRNSAFLQCPADTEKKKKGWIFGLYLQLENAKESELLRASPPGPPPGLWTGPTGGLTAPTSPSCVQQWPTVIASCACGATPDPVSGNNWVITKYASQFFKASYGPELYNEWRQTSKFLNFQDFC